MVGNRHVRTTGSYLGVLSCQSPSGVQNLHVAGSAVPAHRKRGLHTIFRGVSRGDGPGSDRDRRAVAGFARHVDRSAVSSVHQVAADRQPQTRSGGSGTLVEPVEHSIDLGRIDPGPRVGHLVRNDAEPPVRSIREPIVTRPPSAVPRRALVIRLDSTSPIRTGSTSASTTL